MKHFTNPAFWKLFNSLPPETQKQARENYELLKADPKHPSLHFKQINKYWSVRVNKNVRALAVKSEGDLIWFWIGGHDEYDRIIG